MFGQIVCIRESLSLFLDDFPIFFIRMRPGPIHPLPICCGIFRMFLNFAKPLKQAHTTSRYPAHKPQAVSDWLNPHYLWSMSAFRYIENVAENATRLIISHEITISI